MSIKDKEKWDAKYLKKTKLLQPRDASINLQKFIKESRGKRAIDIACGAGRNSIYMAKNGFEVDSLDIAKLALETLDLHAKEQGLSELINTQLIDLDNFIPQRDIYDLALMANFLDRDVIELTKNSLKKDAIFIVETYMIADDNEKTDSDPQNLLAPNELKDIFASGWDILFYDEFENESYELYSMKKQVLVAKKL